MTSYVLDPFRFALKGLQRLSTVGKPTQAPRLKHAPHAACAEGVQWLEALPEGYEPEFSSPAREPRPVYPIKR